MTFFVVSTFKLHFCFKSVTLRVLFVMHARAEFRNQLKGTFRLLLGSFNLRFTSNADQYSKMNKQLLNGATFSRMADSVLLSFHLLFELYFSRVLVQGLSCSKKKNFKTESKTYGNFKYVFRDKQTEKIAHLKA